MTERAQPHAGRSAVPDARHLRRFGLVMAIAFGALGGLFTWRERFLGPYLLALAAAFLLGGLVTPRWLAPVERVWMAFAHRLGIVMTYVILTLTFFVVITPLAFALRLLGKDILSMRWEPGRATYWTPVEPDGPSTRPDKPF